VNATDFQTEVIEASHDQPVLVDFWAPWCGPCRIIGPVLEKLAAESNGKWRLVKVDTDQNTAVASRYQISSIPAVKLFIDGEVVSEFVGALPEPRVRSWLEGALPSKHKASLEQAEAALAKGDDADAQTILGGVLADDPDNADAKLLLARALLFVKPERAREMAREAAAKKATLIQSSGAIETVAALVGNAATTAVLAEGAGKEGYARALAALAAKDFDGAVGHLIDVLRVDRRYDNDAARKACVAIFGLLGDKSAVMQKYYRAFQMAVF
jgi:putative thioredoxin